MENPSADALAFSVPDLNEQPDLHGQTVWVVDTLSRIYQLFHALPEMTSPQGVPVSAVFGFARDLLDIIEKKKAEEKEAFLAHRETLKADGKKFEMTTEEVKVMLQERTQRKAEALVKARGKIESEVAAGNATLAPNLNE